MEILEHKKTSLLIIAALKNELAPIKKYLNEFNFDNIIIDFLISGVGKKNTLKNINNYYQTTAPDFVLNVGTCGCLNSCFEIGTIVVPNSFISDDEEKIEIDIQKMMKSPKKYNTATLVSSKTPIVKAKQKEELYKLTQADVVDMEAFWVAEFCQQNGIPFISLKVISDYAENLTISEFKQQLSKIASLLTKPAIDIIKMVEIYGK